MKLTVYLVVHVDYPEESLLNEFVGPEGVRPDVHFKLESAQKSLESYLEQGLEFTIKTLELRIE